MIHIEPINKGIEIYANTRDTTTSLTSGNYFNKAKKEHYKLRDSLTGAEVEQCLDYLVSKGHTKLLNDLTGRCRLIEEAWLNGGGEYTGERDPFSIAKVHDGFNSCIPPEERSEKYWYKNIWGVYTNTIEQLYEEGVAQQNQAAKMRDLLRKNNF